MAYGRLDAQRSGTNRILAQQLITAQTLAAAALAVAADVADASLRPSARTMSVDALSVTVDVPATILTTDPGVAGGAAILAAQRSGTNRILRRQFGTAGASASAFTLSAAGGSVVTTVGASVSDYRIRADGFSAAASVAPSLADYQLVTDRASVLSVIAFTTLVHALTMSADPLSVTSLVAPIAMQTNFAAQLLVDGAAVSANVSDVAFGTTHARSIIASPLQVGVSLTGAAWISGYKLTADNFYVITDVSSVTVTSGNSPGVVSTGISVGAAVGSINFFTTRRRVATGFKRPFDNTKRSA